MRAGQVVAYPFGTPLTYGFMTRTYGALTEALQGARTDVV